MAKEYGVQAGGKEYLGWVAAFALASGTTMIMMIPFWMRLPLVGVVSLLLLFLVPDLVFYLFEVWRVSTGERFSAFDELFICGQGFPGSVLWFRLALCLRLSIKTCEQSGVESWRELLVASSDLRNCWDGAPHVSGLRLAMEV